MAIELDIRVDSGAIVLGSNAGNVRLLPGTDVVWSTKDPNRTFSLDFFTLTSGGTPSPFTSGAVTATVKAGQPFRAQIRKRVAQGDLDAFKYSVSTSGLTLDPVIIIEE